MYTLVNSIGTSNTPNTNHIAISPQTSPIIPEMIDAQVSYYSPFESNSPRLSLPMYVWYARIAFGP